MDIVSNRYNELVKDLIVKDTPFSWFLFDQAKLNTRYYYPDFKEQAGSVEAYLDAMAVAYSAGDKIKNWLDMDDWGSCFVYATLGIRLNDKKLFNHALDNLNKKEETHYREIVDACLWDKSSDIAPWLMILHEHESPVAQQTAIAVARTNKNTLQPEIVQSYMDNQDPAVRVQFLNWLGEHDAKNLLPFISENYTHDNQDIAFAATRAGFLYEDPSAKNRLEAYALKENPHMLDAIALIFIKETDQNILKTWLDKLWGADGLSTRVKLYGTALSGLSGYVDKLFQLMVDKETSRAAGEAFTILTGIDIEDNDLDAAEDCAECDDEDIAEELTLAERRQEDSFISDWEDDLPYPCPDATSNWWQTNKGSFTEDARYLSGLEITKENLAQILENGNQRQRHIAAEHLFINHNAAWFDCGWPVSCQTAGDN